MSALDYLAYVAMIVLPGYGFGELLGVWSSEDDFVVMLTYVVGLGLAVDTLVFVVRTCGASLDGLVLRGFGVETVYFLIGVGAVALAFSGIARQGLRRPPKPSKGAIGAILICLFMGLILVLYFRTYPIFPQYIFADFHRHVSFATGLANGNLVTDQRQILYGGIEYQLGAGLVLVGGESLVTAQRIVAILMVASPLFIYAAAIKLFESERVALLTTIVYGLTGTIWVTTELISGLYANIFGILAALLLIVVFVDIANDWRSWPRWCATLLVLGCVYFSHFTVISLLPVFVAVGLLSLRKREGLQRYLLPAGVVIAPAVVGTLLFPRVASYISKVSYQTSGAINSLSSLAAAFSPVPVLSYLAVVFDNDLGFAVTMILLAVAVYGEFRDRKLLIMIPMLWLAALFVAAPADASAWRFSIEATVPLTLLAGYGLHTLMPRPSSGPKKRRDRISRRDRQILATLVVLVFLVPMVFGSPTQTFFASALGQTSNALVQTQEYTAIQWLGQNTPPGSRYLTIDDPQFIYINLILGRNCTYDYFTSVPPALQYAHSNNVEYIIVALATSYAVPKDEVLSASRVFQPSSNLTLVYQTDEVHVFRVL